MRAVVQRVKKSCVRTRGKAIGEIGAGLLVFLAVHVDDTEDMIKKMADKIMNLRIFDDENGVMNKSIKDSGGEILVVSQFTLYGDTNKGNRPSYIKSARPDKAIPFYDNFVKYIKEQGIKTETGVFGAMMEVSLVNDGPVTIIIDI